MKEPTGKQYLRSLGFCFCTVLQVFKKCKPAIKTKALFLSRMIIHMRSSKILTN